MESYVHRGIFRIKLEIYDGAFVTSVKPYFKNVLNSIKLPLGSIFCITHPIVKKLTTVKTLGQKSFVNNRTIFFSKFQIMQWNGIISKSFLNQHLLKVRSSFPEVFCEKGFLRNFKKLTEKQLCQSFFFNKVSGLRPATL